MRIGDIGKDFLSESEVAQLLGVHRSTISRLVRRSDFPLEPVLQIGSRRIYSCQELKKILEARNDRH